MITLNNEFKMRTEPLSKLMVDVMCGKMSLTVFDQRFAKAFVECMNKTANPKNLYNDIIMINVYAGVLDAFIEMWKADIKKFDDRSKERDDTKRFESAVDHVFGLKPNARAATLLKEILQ